MWVITKGVTPSYALSASLPARQLFSWAILPPVLSSGTVLRLTYRTPPHLHSHNSLGIMLFSCPMGTGDG